MGVDVMSDQMLKRRDLNSSHTLGYTGKTGRKPSPNLVVTSQKETQGWSDSQETKGPECI